MSLEDRLNQLSQESAAAAEQKIEEDQAAAAAAAEQKIEEDQAAAAAAAEQKIEINDESVLKYLRENRGIETDSLDSLLNPKAPELSFASDEVNQFNEYVKTTKRGMLDFINSQKDWTKVSDLDVAREYYLQNNPGSMAEDFDNLYDVDLKPLEGDDYTPAEIEQRNREISKRNTLIRIEANRGRNFFNEVNAKLKEMAPVKQSDNQDAAGRELWKNGVVNAAKDFNLGIDGYTHDATPEKLIEKYSSIENILNGFKNSSGQLDVNRLMLTLERGQNFDKIQSVMKEQIEAQVTERITKELENPGSTRGSSHEQGGAGGRVQELNNQSLDNLKQIIRSR